MQGFATRTMLQQINTNPLPDELLAPECEAPPASVTPSRSSRLFSSRGSSSRPSDPRDPESRQLFRGALMILCLLGIFAITVRDVEVRSQPPAPAIAASPNWSPIWSQRQAAALAPGQSTCIQDWREGDCYQCLHRDADGNRVGTFAC